MGKLEEKTINSKYIYKGRIVNLRNDEVRLPNGKMSNREVVEHSGAVAVVALTDDDKIVLIKQFRKPVEEELYEIPAGIPEAGEDGVAAAKRELREETGYVAGKVERIGQAYATPGYSSELIKYYLARRLEKKAQALDPDEAIDVVLVPFNEALSMIKDGRIKDNKTILTILWVDKFF